MQPRCVIIVDGDTANQEQLSSRLQTLGGMVIYQIAKSEQLFSGLASRAFDTPDLLIIESQLSGMSGVSVVEKIIATEELDCAMVLLTDNPNYIGIPHRRVVTIRRPTDEVAWMAFLQRIDTILLRSDIRSDVSNEIVSLREYVETRFSELDSRPKTYADVLHRVYCDIRESPGWATVVAGVMAGVLGVLAMAVTKILK